MRQIARCAAILSLLMTAGLAAETVFEIIELRYRTAEELLPVLRPMVEPEGTLSTAQNKLIVRAPRERVTELRKLVAQLDTAPRMLLVTVRQGGSFDRSTQATGVGGRGRFGDVTVSAPPADPSLPGIAVAGSDGTVEIRSGTRESRGSDNGDQQLRVMDGREAVIYVGQEVPYTAPSAGPGGRVVEFRSVLTGFVVRPQVQGDRVTLDVGPQKETLDPASGGAVNVSRLNTRISGQLGEWIDLGAVTQQSTTESRGTLSRSRTDSENHNQVMVKVELLPQ